MNFWRFECKDNNAAFVKAIMPRMFCDPMHLRAYICEYFPINTEQRSQKELDISSDWIIIRLTN